MALGTIIFDCPMAGIGQIQSISIASLTYVTTSGTTVATCTLSANLSTLNLVTGSSVYIYDVSPVALMGVFTITKTANTVFTYTFGSSPLGTGSATLGTYACATIGDANNGVGNVGGVTGGASGVGFYKYPRGRYKSGDTTPANLGWGGVMDNYTTQNTSQFAIWDIDNAPGSTANVTVVNTGGLVVCDFYFGKFISDSVSSHNVQILSVERSNTQVPMCFSVNNAGTLDFNSPQGLFTNIPNITPMPLQGWLTLAIGYCYYGSGPTLSIGAYVAAPGDTKFTQLYTVNNIWPGGGIDLIRFGNYFPNGSGAYHLPFKIARPRLYPIATLADVPTTSGSTLFTGYVAPPISTGQYNPNTLSVTQINNYISAGGSDSNDGVTTATAIQTVTELNNRTGRGGILSINPASPLAYDGCGEAIIGLTANAAIRTSTTNLYLQCDGLALYPQSGENFMRVDNTEVLTAAGWSAVSGTAGVYQTSDTDGTTSDYVWQDQVPLARVTSTVACQNTTGSFYNASTSLIQANLFNSVNPNTSTNVVMRRSNVCGGTNGYYAAVNIAANHVLVNGLYSDATTAAGANDTSALDTQQSANTSQYAPGNYTVSGCSLGTVYGGGYHTFTDAAPNAISGVTKNITDCWIGPCLNGTPLVIAPASMTHGVVTYTRISCPGAQIVPGSTTPLNSGNTVNGTAGSINSTLQVFTAHSTQIDTLTFGACNFPGGVLFPQSAATLFNVTNGSVIGQAIYNAMSNTTLTLSNVTSQLDLPGCTNGPNTLGATFVNDSILIASDNAFSHTINTPGQTLSLIGCTIDSSKCTSANWGTNGLYDCTNVTSLTVSGCVFIGNNVTTNQILFSNLSSSASITFNNNEATGFSATTNIANGLGNGSMTLAQFRAQGYETNSKYQGIDAGFTLAVSASNNPAYSRTAPSTVKYNRGKGSDRYTGVTCGNLPFAPNQDAVIFSNRSDAGATQFIPSGGLSSGGGGSVALTNGNFYSPGAQVIGNNAVFVA